MYLYKRLIGVLINVEWNKIARKKDRISWKKNETKRHQHILKEERVVDKVHTTRIAGDVYSH